MNIRSNILNCKASEPLLFQPLPERPTLKSNESTLIPLKKLIYMRKKAGRNWQKEGINKLKGMFSHVDRKDILHGFKKSVESYLFYEPIIRAHGNGVEFCTVTFISPQYISILEKVAKASQRKREASQRFEKRVNASRTFPYDLVEKGGAFLGNRGNNLDKFEKPIREKRYRIQEFIQKNDLVPGEYIEEQVDLKTGEITDGYYHKSTVCRCGNAIGGKVHLNKNTEFGNCNFSGIATCNSVWACPVCRAKIVNRRAKALDEIFKNGVEKGYKFHMLTFTFSHGKTENLAELYGSSNLRTGLSGAFTKFRQSRKWAKEFKSEIELIGDVRAVEITWGKKNGFHPHIHLVTVSKHGFNIKEWEKKLLKQWQKNCRSSGIGIPNERGLKIDRVNSSEMITYLTKWSVGSELSSESVKNAKSGNHSIAELELMLIDDFHRSMRLQGFSCERVAGILKGYYSAMKGQKQLVFGGSKGWRKELLNENIDVFDEGLSSDELIDEGVSVVCEFENKLYQALKKAGVLTEIIEKAESVKSNTLDEFKINAFKAVKSIIERLGFNANDLSRPEPPG